MAVHGQAQTDSAKTITIDSLIKTSAPLTERANADSLRKAFSPKKATLRSAILPGWGQAYNKKYWKIPIIYGALGTTGAVLIFNLKNYRTLRFAYAAKYKAALPPGQRDSTDYFNIDPTLFPLDINSLRLFRDEFRRNIDYSVLFMLLFWGLNVVDATVDAHLKTFDVSPDLSFKIKLGKSYLGGTTGLSLVLAFK